MMMNKVVFQFGKVCVAFIAHDSLKKIVRVAQTFRDNMLNVPERLSFWSAE
jgi:hypothetical protein